MSAQAMETARAKNTGTLQYEIYFRDDQSECIVLERYRDSEALAEHAANLGELGQAILATGLVSSELLGELLMMIIRGAQPESAEVLAVAGTSDAVPHIDPMHARAAQEFAGEVAAGRTPSIRAIRQDSA